MRVLRWAPLVLLLVVVGLAFAYRMLPVSAVETPPNIVVIMTDDQNVDSMPVMRKLMAFPEGAWVTFANAFANDAKCCPSRAAALTGQFGDHHGVSGNGKGFLLDDSNTLPVWLDKAGYETGFIGKYFIGFPWSKPENYRPPGWDYFHERKGNVDSHSDLAVQFIEDSPRPFYLQLSYTAPHHKAAPPARYENVDVYIPPDPPNFNEADVSDKPEWVQELPLLEGNLLEQWRKERANAQRELLAVDDGVQRIVDALKATGQLDNTLIIFESDHGFSWGAHRWIYKNCPYDECSQFPLMIRFPGTAGNRVEPRLVSNVDLVATIADYAGVTPGLPQDGRSLIPMLEDPSSPWQEAILMERHSDDAEDRFYAIRLPGWMYAEYQNGDRELYDLTYDPYEMENVVDDSQYQAVGQQLAGWLVDLREGVVLPTPDPNATPVVTVTPGPSPTPPATAVPTIPPTLSYTIWLPVGAAAP